MNGIWSMSQKLIIHVYYVSVTKSTQATSPWAGSLVQGISVCVLSLMTLDWWVRALLTNVVIVDVGSVAAERNGDKLERIEQNVGVVEWNAGDIRIHSNCAWVAVSAVKLEVVVELEPELLVSTELLLSVLIIGVHQTLNFVVNTTLIPFAIAQCSCTVTSGVRAVGQFFQVECNILLVIIG